MLCEFQDKNRLNKSTGMRNSRDEKQHAGALLEVDGAGAHGDTTG